MHVSHTRLKPLKLLRYFNSNRNQCVPFCEFLCCSGFLMLQERAVAFSRTHCQWLGPSHTKPAAFGQGAEHVSSFFLHNLSLDGFESMRCIHHYHRNTHARKPYKNGSEAAWGLDCLFPKRVAWRAIISCLNIIFSQWVSLDGSLLI